MKGVGAGKRGLECESTAREKKGGRVPEREVPESEAWSASPLHGRRKKGGCRKARFGVRVHCTGEERREGAGMGGCRKARLRVRVQHALPLFLGSPTDAIVCLITVVYSARRTVKSSGR